MIARVVVSELGLRYRAKLCVRRDADQLQHGDEDILWSLVAREDDARKACHSGTAHFNDSPIDSSNVEQTRMKKNRCGKQSDNVV